MRVEPTEAAKAQMNEQGVQWREVELTALDPEVVRPAVDRDPLKRFHDREGLTVCVARHQHVTELLMVVAVYSRARAEGPAESLIPVRRSQRRYAGAGNARGLYPTSFEELVSILNGLPGCRVEKTSGGKHPIRIVTDKGEKYPIPSSGSDWRAVKNAIVCLRRMGLDPKRRRASA